MGVIIGMDPHKRSATIELIDERARVLATGRYGTDKAGYAEMLRASRKFEDRVWAVEGCNGVGRHIAHRRGCSSVPSVTGEIAWGDLELGAPVIARLGVARLNAARVALLGTLRADGSPRISPIEPYLACGELITGALAWSTKAADLRRDPRYVLHSAVTDPDAGEGELKLYGLAMEATQDLRSAPADAWWLGMRQEAAIVFCLRITRAAFVEWDTSHGMMTVHRWSPEDGYHQASRSYP